MLILISPVTDMCVSRIQDSGLPCDSLSPQPQCCCFVLYTMGHKKRDSLFLTVTLTNF